MKSGFQYKKIVNSLKRRRKGSTVSDICAATALPLSAVRELLPKAADEYSGHLRVTENGEILYYFPNGFTSRYRSISTRLKKIFEKTSYVIKKFLVYIFKFWIMIMLFGYFIIFILLALATVFLQIAARSNSKGRSGSVNFSAFNFLIRIWFYSELTKPRYGGNLNRNSGSFKSNDKQPMHKAIFSFIFGEEDPNRDWEEQQNKAIIAYCQANKGVISLVEYMAFTGENSPDAEKSILYFCSKFEGSPEVTENGTIVYYFEKLLTHTDRNKLKELAAPVKRLKLFSVNSKKKNGWFIAVNAFNLIFGSYFLYQSFAAGHLISEIQYQAASAVYAYTHLFLQFVIYDPHTIIRIALGIVPLVFSMFFWIIPAVRNNILKKENKKIKLSNFKRFSFNRIWSSPKNIEKSSLQPSADEFKPGDIDAAADRVIKDISAVSNPEIEVTPDKKTIYSFYDLEREKVALEKYRSNIDLTKVNIGKTIFDTGELT